VLGPQSRAAEPTSWLSCESCARLRTDPGRSLVGAAGIGQSIPRARSARNAHSTAPGAQLLNSLERRGDYGVKGGPAQSSAGTALPGRGHGPLGLQGHPPRAPHSPRCGALGAERRVLAVAGTDPRLVGQRPEQPLLDVVDQAGEPLGVLLRVADAGRDAGLARYEWTLMCPARRLQGQVRTRRRLITGLRSFVYSPSS
jgi:hypothetical protein